MAFTDNTTGKITQVLLGVANRVTQHDKSFETSKNPWKFLEQKKTNKLFYSGKEILLKESKMDLWRGFGDGTICNVLNRFTDHIPFCAVKQLELYLAKTEILQKKGKDLENTTPVEDSSPEIYIEDRESSSESESDKEIMNVTYEGSVRIASIKKNIQEKHTHFKFCSKIKDSEMLFVDSIDQKQRAKIEVALGRNIPIYDVAWLLGDEKELKRLDQKKS